jgi:hypothetical protein
VIANTANIFFDYNPPVITEPSVLTTEFSTGVQGRALGELLIFPDPASDEFHVASQKESIVRVRIIGVDGRMVLDRSVIGTRIRIATAAMTDGMYVLVAELAGGGSLRRTFQVIQR